jgi:hypothetical protein
MLTCVTLGVSTAQCRSERVKVSNHRCPMSTNRARFHWIATGDSQTCRKTANVEKSNVEKSRFYCMCLNDRQIWLIEQGSYQQAR